MTKTMSDKCCVKYPRLFKSFTHNTKEGYGRNLNRWFGTFLIKIGMNEERLAFHSIRHTARLCLKQHDIGNTRKFVPDKGSVKVLVREYNIISHLGHMLSNVVIAGIAKPSEVQCIPLL